MLSCTLTSCVCILRLRQCYGLCGHRGIQALIASSDDDGVFARQLASRLRVWLLALPAGVGLATLKATLKLCLGFPPHRSGVLSAGNGPAMRSAVLGAAIDDMDLLRRLVRASTRLTHTDPKAEYGAMAVAVAANMSSHDKLNDGASYMSQYSTVRPAHCSVHDVLAKSEAFCEPFGGCGVYRNIDRAYVPSPVNEHSPAYQHDRERK